MNEFGICGDRHLEKEEYGDNKVKPQGTLKAEDKYQTKIELATEIITELIELGLNIELVLADSLSGESSQFVRKLAEYNLAYVVAIRSNHYDLATLDRLFHTLYHVLI